MHKVDTLIVGLGLAGMAYADTLYRNNKTFHVIDLPQSGSSILAGGIYNPTVLKRYNISWKGTDFYDYALPFYRQLEDRFKAPFLHHAPIKKIFSTPSDHNQWVVASDKAGLSRFLDPTLYKTQLPGVRIPYGFGQVNHCGRLDIPALLSTFQTWLDERISFEIFSFDRLSLTSKGIQYGEIHAEHLVFCEGFRMKTNPYFKRLPLQGSKGEMFQIYCPQLDEQTILKGPLFLVPLGDHLFWAGASYEPNDKSLKATNKGREWLESKIEKMITADYQVVKHLAQIRPTVKDRRPLIGKHHEYQRLFVLNGMGSRGVLTAPLAAKWLFDSIYHLKPLPSEVNIDRFKK